jgi:hypothetical protein
MLPPAAAVRRPLRDLFAGAGIVGALWLLAVSRWVVADNVVPWDSKNQFYAFFRFLAQAVSSGSSPFWNPFHYGGHPSIADPQSLIFAPAFVVWAFFDPSPSLRAFDTLVYAHLLAGGVAMVAIGWRANWPLAACVLAAVVFMFGGAAAGRLQHTGIILSYAMFPPAMLLLQVALQRRSIVNGILFSFVAASIVLGRNQVALLLCFLLAAIALAEILAAARPLAYLQERASTLAAMAAATLALVAIPMLLTLQFAALSNRPAAALDAALQGSLHPTNFATAMFANAFGTHDSYWGPGWATLPDVASTDSSFNYLFVGAVPVILLLWVGLAAGGIARRGRILLAATLAVSILYMMGRYTPAFAWAFATVPGIDLFRRPVDASFVFVIALALLAGHLLSDWIRDGIPQRRMLGLLLVVASTAAMVAGAIWFSGLSGHGWSAGIEIVKAAPVPLAVIGVLVAMRHVRARTWGAAALTAIAAAELLWWNAGSGINAQSRAHYAVLEHPTPADAQAIAVLERALRERQDLGERPRVEVLGLGGPWQNLAMVRGWEATNGYNPMRIGFYDKLVSPGETNFGVDGRSFPGSFAGYDCALARALGLEFVVLGQPIEEVPRLTNRAVAEVLLAGPKVWIYRLRNPMPRLTFTTRIQVADTDAVGNAGNLPVDPAADRVVIDDDTPPARSYAAAAPVAGHARIVSWELGRMEIEVEAERGGALAIHSTDYPGWIAEVDGKPVPILRADVMFRAVEVPSGLHRVVLRFAPLSVGNLADALRSALHGADPALQAGWLRRAARTDARTAAAGH